MEHINDIELFEYLSDRLPDAKSQPFQRHIDECSECRKRYQDAIGVWGALGQWRVDSTGHEVVDGIEELAAKDKSDQRKSNTKTIPLIISFKQALRVAAAIIIAISGGHLLGRYSVSKNTPELPVSQEGPRYL
jgi:anti-sigma factor RsiW